MGVRGLTSYINSIESLWTQTELRNTKLVIDGPGLCNCLYLDSGFDRQCGGQYEEFYNVVLSFFAALDSRGVDSFVVLDGAHDRSDKKLDTFKKRSAERIESGDALCNDRSTDGDVFVPPLMSNLVFVQALRDGGVKFAVPDCEADAEVAFLANAWNCPVLSNDSDFFIFDIKAGYIPLSSFDWKSSRLSAKIFHQRKLASHLRIHPELLPMFASLVGNDYVSRDALEPFTRALSQYSTDNSSRKEARFAGIANMLSTVPDTFVLQMVSSYGGVPLRQAVEHSLQEYSITESNLLRYFQNGVISSSLRTQNGCKIDEWVLRNFREAQFSTNCMSGLTSGKVLLRFQVENCREKSANFCSQKLRRFVYGILNDAEAYNRRGNVEMVEEWDREGLTVKPSIVTPYQEGVVRVSLIPFLDAENRLMVLLNALDSNTPSIRLLPDKFKLIAASLRFLKSNAQPPLKPNHIAAILSSCIKLEDGSWKQYMESTNRRMSLSHHPFDQQAAQSFAQWQCVLRDAVHLNFVLLEPVETPCIHKTFNGRLAHCLQNELDRGSMPEELLRSSSNSFLYNEICNALEREGTNSVGQRTKYPGATHQNSYQTRNSYRFFSNQSHAPTSSTSAVYSPTKRWEEHVQARQPNQVSTRRQKQQQQQQQRVSSSQYNSSYKRPDRPIYHSPVPQGGASPSLPLSSSKELYQRQQYAQPSVSTSGHHARKPLPATPTSNRVVQRAYTEQIREDEISARIQNLNLSANSSHMYSSKDFTAGKNKHWRSALPPKEVSPPGWMSPSSKSASAASYSPMGYRNESKPPLNTRAPRALSTATSPAASHYSQSSTPRRDKPVCVSSVRSAYDQRFFYDSSTRVDSPLPPDESWSVSDSPRSSDECWSDYYNDEAPPDFAGAHLLE